MSHGSEAAEQMTRDSVKIGEAAVKLTALGAKNLALLCIALARENEKLRGKTKMTRIIKSGKPPMMFDVKESDLKKFTKHCKIYGVLFTVVKNSRNENGCVDVITYAENVAQVNRILERMNYALPQQEGQSPKKEESHAVPERVLNGHEHGSKEMISRSKGDQRGEQSRPSVRTTIERIKISQDKNLPVEPVLPRRSGPER